LFLIVAAVVDVSTNVSLKDKLNNGLVTPINTYSIGDLIGNIASYCFEDAKSKVRVACIS